MSIARVVQTYVDIPFVFPHGFSKRYLDLQEAVCHSIGMTREDMQLVFGGNASRILQLEDALPVEIE